MAYHIVTDKKSPQSRTAVVDNRTAARALAKESNGFALNDKEWAHIGGPEWEAAANVVVKEDPVFEKEDTTVTALAPADQFLELAAQVKADGRMSRTLGEKTEKVAKVAKVTAPATIAAAKAYMLALPANMAKTHLVRILAAWQAPAIDGVVENITRGDAIRIFAELYPYISPSTVTTQWQLVKSGQIVVKAMA